MSAKLTFLGCGDAFSSGGRYTTCFYVESGETRFFLDFGATAMAAAKARGLEPSRIPLIFITHLHGDHIGGLPFLLLESSLVYERTEPLTIAGPPGLRAHLPRLIDTLFPGTELKLPFELNVLELPPDVRSEVAGIGVTPHLVKHAPSITCTGLRLELGDKVLAYSGDTVWTDTLPKLARDADLFICDAYTFDKPTGQHLDYATLKARYTELGPKRLVLTHMGQAFLDRLKAGERPDFETAEDGLEVEF